MFTSKILCSSNIQTNNSIETSLQQTHELQPLQKK